MSAAVLIAGHYTRRNPRMSASIPVLQGWFLGQSGNK